MYIYYTKNLHSFSFFFLFFSQKRALIFKNYILQRPRCHFWSITSTAHYLYPFLAMNCSYDCLVTGKIMIKACGTHKKDNIMLYVFYSIIAEWSHGIVTAHAKHSPASGLQGETMFWMWHFHKALSLYYHILVLCPCQYSVFCQWQAVSRSRAMYSAVLLIRPFVMWYDRQWSVHEKSIWWKEIAGRESIAAVAHV